MKTNILGQLLTDRAAKRQVVVATDLTNGDGQLIYPAESDAADDLNIAARRVMVADKSGVVELADGRKLFLHVHNPPLRMLVVGAVHIAQSLAEMARLAGFQVVVVDPRQAFARSDRFVGIEISTDWPDQALEQLGLDGRTAVVTLTHDPKLDDPALDAALASPAFYIGSLGSKKTHRARLERLASRGFAESDRERIRGPVGLSIGSVTPAEIAVSILAEVIRALRSDSS